MTAFPPLNYLRSPSGIGTAAMSMLLLTGCADGFVPEARSLNPYARKEWEADEKHGPTYYKRMDELRNVRSKASSLSPAERERISREIAGVLSTEKSPVMRAELAKSLGSLPGPTAFSALEGSVTDTDPEVRVAACFALGGQKNPAAIPLLAQAVNDTDADVRMEAARSLGKYKEPEATQALALALEEPDPAMQRIVMQSLRTTTGKDYGQSVKAWREYLDGGNPKPPDEPSWAERLKWPWY